MERPLGIPAGAWIILVIYGLCWLLLRRMPWGRHVVATGCDERAARLVGVNVERVKIQTYALLGLLAGVAAVLYVARLRNVEVNIGTNVALEAIAATVLGGASIRGGVGSLMGALLGVLFIKLMQNGLVLVGISSLWETVVIGGLLLLVLATDAIGSKPSGERAVIGGRRVGPLLALTALVAIAGALLSPAFLQGSTVTFILQYMPILGVLSVAQAIVMLSGGPGIDLSVGSTLSLTGLAIAVLAANGWPLAFACSAGLALGAVLGAANGWLVAVLGVPALMATLGTMFLYGGLAVALTGGAPIGGLPDSFGWLAQGRTLGVPNHVWAVLAPVAVVTHVGLTRTRAGAHLHAAGCDERAAFLAGVPVWRLRFAIYVARRGAGGPGCDHEPLVVPGGAAGRGARDGASVGDHRRSRRRQHLWWRGPHSRGDRGPPACDDGAGGDAACEHPTSLATRCCRAAPGIERHTHPGLGDAAGSGSAIAPSKPVRLNRSR